MGTIVKNVTDEQADVLLTAALHHFRSEVELSSDVRTGAPEEFKELHDVLVALGQIDPEPEFDTFDWAAPGEAEDGDLDRCANGCVCTPEERAAQGV